MSYIKEIFLTVNYNFSDLFMKMISVIFFYSLVITPDNNGEIRCEHKTQHNAEGQGILGAELFLEPDK